MRSHRFRLVQSNTCPISSHQHPRWSGWQVVRVLLDERDQYLAWCLHRSKAVNGAERVVGVVGLAHLRGIAFHLQDSDGNLRFKDLVGRLAHP